MGEIDSLEIVVAGIGFRFRGPGDMRRRLARRYGAFEARKPLGGDTTTIELALDDDHPLPSGPQFRVATEGDHVRLIGPHVDARVSKALTSATVAGPRSERPVDAVLRMVLSARLLARGGLLGHASAVLVDGRAWVFPGPSGIGKTTTAYRLAERGGVRARVLCDEAVALLPDGQGGLSVHATPYWLAEPGSAPVAALLFPKRGSRRWTSLSKGAATAQLMSSVGPLLPGAASASMSAAAWMAQRVETAEIHMNQVEDIEAWLAPRLQNPRCSLA